MGTDQRLDQKQITVVVVDDSSEVRFLLATIMDLDGRFRIVGEASDAREAITVVTALEPQLVLVDLQLGRQNGAWLIKQLRRRGNAATIAVVTGSAQVREHEAALHAGADSVHSKMTMTTSMGDDLATTVARRGMVAA